MSIPAAIAISKLRYPETGEPLTAGKVTVARDKDKACNALHAYSKGAIFGLVVAGFILANVLTVLALLYTVDGILTWIGQFWGFHRTGPHALTLELIFQYLFFPLAVRPNTQLVSTCRCLMQTSAAVVDGSPRTRHHQGLEAFGHQGKYRRSSGLQNDRADGWQLQLVGNEFIAYSQLAPQAATFTPRGYSEPSRAVPSCGAA